MAAVIAAVAGETLRRRGTDPGAARPGRRRLLLVTFVLAAIVGAFVLGHVTASAFSARSPDGAAGAPGPVDIGFAQDMGAHHNQAVLMSSLAEGRAGPAVKAIASSILGSQSQELGAMHGWLGLWGKPVQSTTPMRWMSGDEAAAAGGHEPMAMAPGATMPGAAMPGMASPQELMALWGKSGTDFDVMFMQLMVRHHQGGQIMTGYAANHARLDVVKQAAASMQFEQAEEIGQMRGLLAAYGRSPLPAP